MMTWLISFFQTVIILALAPLGLGLIRKFKARLQNRVGASIWLPYVALLTLAKKQMTVSKHASWVFRGVPFALLAVTALLALLVPTFAVGGLAGASGNFFLISALLMLGAGALVLGGMDTGSAFGGMGSSREMTLAALSEPAIVLIFCSLGAVTGAWTGDGAVAALANGSWLTTHPFLILVFAGLALIVLAESARYPVDNPSTHLELTMVHEAMTLEYSGPYLAMIEYSSAIKFVVLAMFLANLLFPSSVYGTGIGLGWSLLAFAAKFIAACLSVAFLESVIAKMRFYRMQEYLGSAYLLVFLGLALSLIF